jgi:hypothetical protein
MVACWSNLLGATTASAADEPPPPPIVSAAPGKGFSIESGNGRFLMNLRGRIQLRESVAAVIPSGENSHEITSSASVYTTRVLMQGHTFSKDIKYALQLALAPRDFKDGAVSPVYDAYVDLTHSKDASVRLGQMYVPFDRIRTTSESELQLPDRAASVGELNLDRDVGAYVYSNAVGGEDGIFAYRLGVFGGSGISMAGTFKEPGGLGVVRLELNPFGPFDANSEGDLERREDPGLSIGAAAAYNANTPRVRSTTSTAFSNGGTADYLHLAADAVFKLRGFGFVGEFIMRDATEDTVETTDETGNPVVEPTRSGWGVVAQPSMMLSREIEVAGRYGHTEAMDGTDQALVDSLAKRSEEIALGLNWYLNKHKLKVQAGWSLFFGADQPAGDGEHLASVLLDATF